jgi:hypothetical protein
VKRHSLVLVAGLLETFRSTLATEDSELRLAEHLYTRVLERNPTFL